MKVQQLVPYMFSENPEFKRLCKRGFSWPFVVATCMLILTVWSDRTWNYYPNMVFTPAMFVWTALVMVLALYVFLKTRLSGITGDIRNRNRDNIAMSGLSASKLIIANLVSISFSGYGLFALSLLGLHFKSLAIRPPVQESDLYYTAFLVSFVAMFLCALLFVELFEVYLFRLGGCRYPFSGGLSFFVCGFVWMIAMECISKVVDAEWCRTVIPLLICYTLMFVLCSYRLIKAELRYSQIPWCLPLTITLASSIMELNSNGAPALVLCSDCFTAMLVISLSSMLILMPTTYAQIFQAFDAIKAVFSGSIRQGLFRMPHFVVATCLAFLSYLLLLTTLTPPHSWYATAMLLAFIRDLAVYFMLGPINKRFSRPLIISAIAIVYIFLYIISNKTGSFYYLTLLVAPMSHSHLADFENPWLGAICCVTLAIQAYVALSWAYRFSRRIYNAA